MKRTVKVVGTLLAPLVAFTAGFGCAGAPNASEPPYAGAIIDGISKGYNDNDYVKYTENFNQFMKSAATPNAFQQVTQVLKSKIGNYVSKTYWKTESNKQYTLVYYKAKFTEEPEVTIRVMFEETGGKFVVAGLLFDSPKLTPK